MMAGSELWRPSRQAAWQTLLAGFMRKTGIGVDSDDPDYDALWEYSIRHPDKFWGEVWEYCRVIGERGDTVLEAGNSIMDARFFPRGRLNYAENLLASPENRVLLIFHGENADRREMSRPQLLTLVARVQAALKADGVGPGDRVVGVVPNTPETVAIMLAVSGLGAIWSSCSPDFGKAGIVDRFGQIAPRVMFCTDGYWYNGKWIPVLDTAVEVAKDLPSVCRLVVSPYGGVDAGADESSAIGLASYAGDSGTGEVSFMRQGFSDPAFILFSSGTTGLPKCIVHGGGGTILQHLKEHQLQCDIRSGDRLMFFTTCGWMMWNWMISALASGATLVLYDGSPLYPGHDRLAAIAAAERISHFGASAKYFDACAKAGLSPASDMDLDALRVVLSTGSPLSPEGFDYIYAKWKRDLCLSSIAGGTDIIGSFVGASPVSPVYRGQCQKRHLGMDTRIFNQDGDDVAGEPGELVCASAHPSMPTGFFNDPDNSRYRHTYFERYPGVWHHGDWAELTPEGGIVFFGRSDATLNPGGVRIGTAEIYRPVEQIAEIAEALVIGRRVGADVEIVLFVRLVPGSSLTDDLRDTIRAAIRSNASPRHVPARIIAVADIPRTKSGKIVELAVRNIVEGKPVGNTEAMANPEALEQFRNLSVLQDGERSAGTA